MGQVFWLDEAHFSMENLESKRRTVFYQRVIEIADVQVAEVNHLDELVAFLFLQSASAMLVDGKLASLLELVIRASQFATHDRSLLGFDDREALGEIDRHLAIVKVHIAVLDVRHLPDSDARGARSERTYGNFLTEAKRLPANVHRDTLQHLVNLVDFALQCALGHQ
jgi:hypothetical protein